MLLLPTMIRLTSTVLLLLTVTIPRAAASATIETEEATNSPTFAVAFRGDTLFRIVAPIGKLPPEQRAVEIGHRLEAIADGPATAADRVGIAERDDRTDVIAADHLILSVTDADAHATGRTRRQLAADDAQIAGDALRRDVHSRSVKGLAAAAAYSLGTTMALVLLFWALGRSFAKAYVLLRHLADQHFVARARVLVEGGVGEILVGTARFVRVLLSAFIVYLYINLTLSFFSWSRGLAQRLFSYLHSAGEWMVHGVVSYLPKLIYILLIVLVTHYVVKFARLAFDAVHRGAFQIAGFYPDWAIPTYKIVRFLIFAFAAVLIFPYLPGSNSPAFKGISVFIGILLSLGSASAIGNVVSGVVLTYMRPFREGDRVRVADTIGDIVGTNLLVVRVRTIKNVEVTIPNGLVLASHIVNYSSSLQESGLILHATVTIGYDAPWRKIHELLLAAAGKTEGLNQSPAPFVLQTALDDFYVHYEINAYTSSPSQMATIYSDLYAHIQDGFNEAGVEIMSPHFTAARDGNRTAIPDQYLPAAYRPPAFRVVPVDFKPTDE